MSTYITTIGLEIHAELKTKTKMFCNSKNDSDEKRPNANVCPICMGHPGTLPVINKEAVKHVLKVGLALGGKIADFTEFDRKNYFYPDIPKGYQLSQYEFPLVAKGSLNGVLITRVHLEEDTGTLIHADENQRISADGNRRESASLVDFNRAGVPLMELVTEPVIHSAKEAGDFARELQLLLRYLGVSDANMEKGEMRVEANISVAPTTNNQQPTTKLGTKVEVKNLNSFKAVERAIEYEVARHTELLDRGERVTQETRGWNEDTQKTFSQRNKEESQDYRYFPDPDLSKLLVKDVPEFELEKIKKDMPELPTERRARYLRDFKIKKEDADLLIANRLLANLFESVTNNLRNKDSVLLASNYITSDLMGLCKKANIDTDSMNFTSEIEGGAGDSGLTSPTELRRGLSGGGVFLFTPEAFTELIQMISGQELSSRAGKDILAILFEKGGSPRTLANEYGLLQKSDTGELERIVSDIIKQNGKVAADYKGGKTSALQFLVGQGMKATKGAANPGKLREVFIRLLAYPISGENTRVLG